MPRPRKRTVRPTQRGGFLVPPDRVFRNLLRKFERQRGGGLGTLFKQWTRQAYDGMTPAGKQFFSGQYKKGYKKAKQRVDKVFSW